MPWINQKNPQMVERAVAGLCYLSGGLIGLLYIVISRSKSQSMFFRFHFLLKRMFHTRSWTTLSAVTRPAASRVKMTVPS